MKQEVYLEESSINDFFRIIKERAPKEIFLIRGKESYELCGAKKNVDNCIRDLGCLVTDFFEFSENPKIEDLEKGLTLLSKSHPNIILAIGGGSVLDMAKLIRFFHSYSGDPTVGAFVKERDLLPLIVLPTTAGTGCETTHFAVLYKNKIKYSVSHGDILPNIAFVYSPFTYNNPKYLTACTGFDALAQAIEAYWNINATEESDEYAMKAINLLWFNLLLAVNQPTKESRNEISKGAYWAGRAINITKTTAPHALSYPFTTYYGYPHGHAVALTFPYFFDLNKSVDALKYKMDIITSLMFQQKTNVKESFYFYLNQIGLSCKLPDNFDEKIISSNINLDRLANNPHVVTSDNIKALLEELKNRTY